MRKRIDGIEDAIAIYLQDDSPNNETQYRARFYVNPNSLTMATGDILDLFTGRNASNDVLRIQLQKTTTSYQIRAGLLNDAGTWTDTGWYDVPNSWSAIEIHYQAFANSGSLTLWLDDVQKQSLTFIDNDTRTLTEVRLGAQGVDTNTNGTLYFDDFESRRFSYIGTLLDPGVNDPQATNQAGWTASTYQYSTTIPHAVTSVSIEAGSTNSYEYDQNGNMICRIENGITYTHTYNAENRASSIAKRSGSCASGTILESWSFAYDGDGVRVSTAHFTGASGTPDSTTAYYMGGQYELKDGTAKKYYSIAGIMVAMHDGTALQYLLTDHLGSTVAITNSTGTLTSQQRYLPFGEPRTIPNSPILATDFGYTGQRMLDEGMGGIMDYKARFYSPALGRFLQPDSILPDPSNPQNFNRYTYTLNNPVLYKDPTGHCIDGVSTLVCIAVAGAIIGAAISYGTQVYDNYQNNGGDLGAALTTNIDAMSIVEGAVAGAVVAVGVAVAAPAVITLAGEALAGAGLMTGSTTLFSAGMSAYSLAGSTAAIVYGSGNLATQINNITRRHPLGYQNQAQFDISMQELDDTLSANNITDAGIGARGSAVTGYSPYKGTQFGPQSDIDVFVESNQLTEGLHTSSTIPGFVAPKYINNPGLNSWSARWSEILGRDISVGGFRIGSVPNDPTIWWKNIR